MKPRYIIAPDVELSRNDRQEHYINAHTLAKLYGVDIRLCHVLDSEAARACYRAQLADIVLRPQYGGDYSIAKLIGQKLRDLRLADNQTQGEAADKAGVTVAQWSAAENGRYILAALAILDRYT